ncbi:MULTISPECIES: hypothetical protein [Prochlorococcus]|nr:MULTISPECIES: hypothetical protein [Prochlorococcus]KGG12795.1 hypothetical protein EV05_0466 [Prochlorococcus sp. MIT 0601]
MEKKPKYKTLDLLYDIAYIAVLGGVGLFVIGSAPDILKVVQKFIQ